MSEKTGKEVATQENKVGFIDKFTSQPDISKALAGYLGAEKNIIRFVSSMRMCFATNPKLKNCSTDSLRNVFLNCAEWGLYPSHVTGECYVIPYKDEATFQLGYQGMITLATRAGVKYIDAQVVYENDVKQGNFKYEYGTNQYLTHTPDKLSSDRGKPVGAYAVATLDSGMQKFEILSEADIFKHRAKSQSYKSSPKYSPWNPDNDPQLIMWRKTALKQLFKFLPKVPQEVRNAMSADTKGDIIDMTDSPANPTDQELMDFVADAHAYLEEMGEKDAIKRTKRINDATFKVTKGEPLKTITRAELEGLKKDLFTGEVIEGDPSLTEAGDQKDLEYAE